MSLVPIEPGKAPVKKSRMATVTPIFKSANPSFNEKAAKDAYDLVMKMDDDSAYMFTHLLMKDVLADDIENNQRTLQTHLNHIVEKRIQRLRQATLSVVRKSHSKEAVEFAKALDEFEKAYKNPYATGAYQFKESDFRRDPTTGQFRTKVQVNPSMKPLGEKQAKNLGIPITEKYKNLSEGRKAVYQQEWLQIANFLNAAAATSDSGLGEHDVELNIQDEHGGRYVRRLNGKPRMGVDWDPEIGERVVGVTARPGDLRLGGVAFGLGSALGSAPKTSTVQSVNAFDDKFKGFSEDWLRETDHKASNAQLYNRVETGAKFVSDVAPDTAIKTQMAARFARAVGEHGPEAEKILGPGIRRLAYRYRGTEKTPETEALNGYRIATGGRGQLTPEQNKELQRNLQGAVNRYRKNKASNQNVPEDAIRLNAEEIAQVRRGAERKWRENRGLLPQEVILTDADKASGREFLARYLMEKERAPKKDLYHLQLESGNTPASQGFIIDSTGNVVTQAQGYGDDHYVPFNFKNMSKLRGGEYIRSRSVGGPTAEDIYTGLATGADRITVVSRSGYYTVEFNPETSRGFFNDKAKRMVRRYENILDAVQSEQVDRPVNVDPEIQIHFRRKVEEQYPGAGPRLQHEYTKRLVKEYKDTLAQTADDMAEFEVYLAEQTDGLPTEQRQRVRSQMINNRQRNNEYKFRLNGQGYTDALNALQEQFPFYISVSSGPLKELEQFASERDKGYVEPGRNRPTEAKAGLYGTSARLGAFGNETGGKFSASQADYQGYFMPRRDRRTEPGQAPGATAPTTTGGNGNGSLAELEAAASKEQSQAAEKREIESVQDKGLALTQEMKDKMDWTEQGGLEGAGKILPPLAMDNPDDIRAWFSKPVNIRLADEKLAALNIKSGQVPDSLKTAMTEYAEASGKLRRVPFDRKLMFQQTQHPFRFPEPPYQEGADPSLAENEAQRLDRTRPVSIGDGTYSTMSQEQLKNELNVLIRVHRGLEEIDRTYDKDDLPGRTEELGKLGVNVSIPGVMQILERNDLDEHAENVHRMMALNLNRGEIHTGRTATLQLPPLDRTEHVDPPPPSNKKIAEFHAQQLTDAITKLTTGISWDSDDPRVRAAQLLGAHAAAYKDAAKNAEVSDDQLSALNDAAKKALIMARAVKEDKGNLRELAIKYRDDHSAF